MDNRKDAEKYRLAQAKKVLALFKGANGRARDDDGRAGRMGGVAGRQSRYEVRSHEQRQNHS